MSGAKGLGTVLVTVPTDVRTVRGARALVAGVVTCACTCLPLGAVPAPAMGDPPVRAWSVA